MFPSCRITNPAVEMIRIYYPFNFRKFILSHFFKDMKVWTMNE